MPGSTGSSVMAMIFKAKYKIYVTAKMLFYTVNITYFLKLYCHKSVGLNINLSHLRSLHDCQLSITDGRKSGRTNVG
jgi:hypothetical protein